MKTGGILIFTDDDAGRQAAERSFGGLSLLERGIRTMARAGVGQLLVLTPGGTKTTIGPVTRKLDLDLEFVEWNQRASLQFDSGQDVLCLLGDHAHHHTSLSPFVKAGSGDDDLIVQTTTPSQTLELLAPRVQDALLQIAPTHSRPDTACTGAFLLDGSLTPHEITTSGLAPAEFLKARSQDRQIRLAPGAPHLWRRVLDRSSARAARAMLFSQVTKATSGPVSRHINARISIPISKLLIETGISPHMVTVLFVMSTGLSAAYLMSHPAPYWRLALAGFLWQMAAVLDRCDGEIARVKLCESQFGAWFDTVTDNIAYLSAYVAFLVAVTKLYPDEPLLLYAGFSAVGAMLLSLGIMYRYALKTGNGSLQKYLVGYAQLPAEQKGTVYRILERYSFIAKRDFFAFVHFLCALSGQFLLLYLYTVGGLHLILLGVVLSQRKMLAYHHEQAGDKVAVETTTGAVTDAG